MSLNAELESNTEKRETCALEGAALYQEVEVEKIRCQAIQVPPVSRSGSRVARRLVQIMPGLVTFPVQTPQKLVNNSAKTTLWEQFATVQLTNMFRGLGVGSAVERTRHVQDSQDQILALALRLKSFKPCKVFPLRLDAVENWV